eukprot:1100041-Amphidinium_carterae.1
MEGSSICNDTEGSKTHTAQSVPTHRPHRVVLKLLMMILLARVIPTLQIPMWSVAFQTQRSGGDRFRSLASRGVS